MVFLFLSFFLIRKNSARFYSYILEGILDGGLNLFFFTIKPFQKSTIGIKSVSDFAEP